MAVFGGYNGAPEISKYLQGVDYIYFTDKDIFLDKPWKKVLVHKKYGLSRVQLNRFFKMLPHKHLRSYDASLYLDGNVCIEGDLASYLEDVSKTTISIFKHPKRARLIEEAAEVFRLNRLPLSDLEKVASQLKKYIQEGYPDNVLMEANIIFRRHDSDSLNSAMDLWWEEFNVGARRDQFSLGYVLWKNNISPNVISTSDRRLKGGLFWCKSHRKFTWGWVKGYFPRKWRMLTTSNVTWRRKIYKYMTDD